MNPDTPFRFFSAKHEGKYWKTEKTGFEYAK